MATPEAIQKMKATNNKKISQDRIVRALAPWVAEIASSYRLGDTRPDPESVAVLTQALRQSYIKAAKDVLTIDIRQYKSLKFKKKSQPKPQKENLKVFRQLVDLVDYYGGSGKQFEEPTIDAVIFTGVSTATNTVFTQRLNTVVPGITATAGRWVESTTATAAANEWTQRQATASLTNHLSRHRLTIAVTESQFAVEITRRTAVLSVTDPLRNSIEQIVQLIEAGDINAALRLSTRVNRLARLPLSVTQGNAVRTVNDARDLLTTPITQGEAVANLRRQGATLGADMKEWQTIGDGKVRDSHMDANGQQAKLDEPFQLAGGLLQYPGDSSLGASLSEIINCRCATIYE